MIEPKSKLIPAKDALRLSREITDAMVGNKIQSQVCGSLRRELDQVHDIDIVVSDLTMAMVATATVGQKWRLPGQNPKKRATVFIDEIQVDLYLAAEEYWGAMTLFLTGSAFFNILTRARAKDMGYKLSQYGLFHNGEIIAGKTEEQILMVLGVKYIEPKNRSLKAGDYLCLHTMVTPL